MKQLKIKFLQCVSQFCHEERLGRGASADLKPHGPTQKTPSNTPAKKQDSFSTEFPEVSLPQLICLRNIFLFHILGNFIIPTHEVIFFRGVG
jgi:hypothetical protein